MKKRKTSSLAAALAVALVVLSTGHPLGVLSGDRLFGVGTADVWGHTWGYFRIAYEPALWSTLTNWPEGQSWWVIDVPIAAVLAPVTWVGGASLAMNMAFLLHIAIGAGTTAAWLTGRVRPVHAVIAGVLVVSPFVRGGMVSGLPEALSVLLLPAFAWALYEGMRRSWPALAAAAVLAPLIVMDGAYGALCVALVGPVVVLAGWERRWQNVARAVVPGITAGVGVGVVQWAFQATVHPALGKDQPPAPWASTDVLDYVVGTGAPLDGGQSHVVYVGVVLVVASALAGRRAWPAWVVAAVAFGLSMGPDLVVAGHVLGPAPGAILSWTGSNNLYRLAGLIPVALIPAVAFVADKRPWIWALIAFEWAFVSPLDLRMPTIPEPAGSVERWLAEQPQDGAVLDLPFDRDGRGKAHHPLRTFHLQSVHRRPVASAVFIEPSLKNAEVELRLADRFLVHGWHQEGGPTIGRVPLLPPAPGEGLRARLAGAGIRFVTVDLERVAPDQRAEFEAWMVEWLGEPDVRDDLRAAWTL